MQINNKSKVTRQDRTRHQDQHKIGQDKNPRQDKTRSDKTRQDRTTSSVPHPHSFMQGSKTASSKNLNYEISKGEGEG